MTARTGSDRLAVFGGEALVVDDGVNAVFSGSSTSTSQMPDSYGIFDYAGVVLKCFQGHYIHTWVVQECPPVPPQHSMPLPHRVLDPHQLARKKGEG